MLRNKSLLRLDCVPVTPALRNRLAVAFGGGSGGGGGGDLEESVAIHTLVGSVTREYALCPPQPTPSISMLYYIISLLSVTELRWVLRHLDSRWMDLLQRPRVVWGVVLE